MSLTRELFNEQKAKLDFLVTKNNERLMQGKELLEKTYTHLHLSTVLKGQSVQDSFVYLQKYLELLRQACRAAYSYQNNSRSAENRKMGWAYFTRTQAAWLEDGQGDRSYMASINVMLEDMHRVLQELKKIIVKQVEDTKTLFTSGQNRKNAISQATDYIKLIVICAAIDASLFSGAPRMPSWVELKQGVRAKDLEGDVSWALGDLLQAAGQSRKLRAVELYKESSPRDVHKYLLNIGLKMLGLDEGWLVNNYQVNLDDRAAALADKFNQLKVFYDFTWEELDGFMWSHFLPIFCASIPSRLSVGENKTAIVQRLAVGRLLESYHAFMLGRLNVKERSARSSVYRSLLLTQVLRGDDIYSIKQLRNSIFLFLESEKISDVEPIFQAQHEQDKIVKALDYAFSSCIDAELDKSVYLDIFKNHLYPLLNKTVEYYHHSFALPAGSSAASLQLVQEKLNEIRAVLQVKRGGCVFCFDELMRDLVALEMQNKVSAVGRVNGSNGQAVRVEVEPQSLVVSPGKRRQPERDCKQWVTNARNQGSSPYKDGGVASYFRKAECDGAEDSPSKRQKISVGEISGVPETALKKGLCS